jgi:hypothetical protein
VESLFDYLDEALEDRNVILAKGRRAGSEGYLRVHRSKFAFLAF